MRGFRVLSRAVLRAVSVVMMGIAVALPANAAPSAEVTRVFQAGVDAYRLGNYREARTHLERARKLSPALPGPHRFLAALAKVEERWTDCIASTRRALELNPQSSETDETRVLHEECRVAAGRPASPNDLGDRAAIAITTNVAGASVRVDKLRYGSTPLAPRPLRPGKHELALEKAGWKSVQLSIDALPGIVTDVDVTLEAAGAKSTAPAKPSARG